MRNAFAAELTKQAKQQEDLVFLSGDIGNRLFSNYKNLYPKKFYNCGVAEANMVGVAAGLALSGMRVVCYTITPFMTFRCLEQIRDDLCYHKLPVVIVGVGAGLSYAGLGPTHHSCEDIAMLRSLPNMTILCPGDALEVKAALDAALKLEGPVYMRLGKKGEPIIHNSLENFEIGKAIQIKEGTELCLLSTGNILPLALEVYEEAEKRGTSTSLISCHTVKPFDMEQMRIFFENHSTIVSFEEHSLIGGFGSALAEWMVDEGIEACRLIRIGTKDAFFHEAGSQSYARGRLGLTVTSILEKIFERSLCLLGR